MLKYLWKFDHNIPTFSYRCKKLLVNRNGWLHFYELRCYNVLSNVTTRINAFSLALIRLFELHISRLKQHTIALKTNRVLQKKSAWLFSFLSSQVHTLWQHHDIKLINEDSGYSRDCIYTCIKIITLHLPKLFTNTTTHCGVSKECTKLYDI